MRIAAAVPHRGDDNSQDNDQQIVHKGNWPELYEHFGQRTVLAPWSKLASGPECDSNLRETAFASSWDTFTCALKNEDYRVPMHPPASPERKGAAKRRKTRQRCVPSNSILVAVLYLFRRSHVISYG
jgi:hypothetical protein